MSLRFWALDHLSLSPETVLVQYVDDRLVASPSEEQCITDTVSLIKHLAAEEHKANLSKLQFLQTSVTFL